MTKPWEKVGEQKRETVRSMFDELAPNYDRLNGMMSLSRHHFWRKQAVRALQLKAGDRALDVCCGTGDFMLPIREAVGQTGEVIGIDFSAEMLGVAKQKKAPGELFLGDATRLPFAPNSFEGVTVGWGIRNVPDIDAAHQEAFRVLKPGGRFVSIDMAVPQNIVVRMGSRLALKLVPMLGKLFGRGWHYQYLTESTLRFWNRERLKQSMVEAGFTDVKWRNFMFGNICMHLGQKPSQPQARELEGETQS